jgi:hypothetical protein
MAKSEDSVSAARVSVSVLRFEEASCGGSMVLGPTPVTRSQFEKPGSVEPASTWGSCMSAPEDGARLSGTQDRADDVAGAAVGRACGLKVDLYVVAFAWTTAADEVRSAACVVFAVVAGVVCGACDVVWTVDGVVAGTENVAIGMVGRTGVRWTLSGWTELADAVDGTNAAETATRAAAAAAHAASEAIGASMRRERARRLGSAERMRRDTGRVSGSDADRKTGTGKLDGTAGCVVPVRSRCRCVRAACECVRICACGKRILREAMEGSEHRERIRRGRCP